VIGPLEPVTAETREVLLKSLVPGSDGLVLRVGRRRATFLPSVWEHTDGPDEFVDQLLRKAGLPPSVWPAGAEAWRYRVEELVANGPR
jgi:AMMECR1 domain-containing protein